MEVIRNSKTDKLYTVQGNTWLFTQAAFTHRVEVDGQLPCVLDDISAVQVLRISLKWVNMYVDL